MRALLVVMACCTAGTATAQDACDAPATIGAVERAAAGKILAPRQVGVAAAVRQRGCAGTLVVDAVRVPAAWIVSVDPQHPGRPVVIVAIPAIVAARFGHIDAGGRFANSAAPLGRAALAQAVRAGVTGMRAAYTEALKSHQRSAGGSAADMAAIDRARAREIADIEPLGACRAGAAAGQYVCSVIIEHHDPLAEELRIDRPTILRGDFTFEQVPGSTTWRVGPAFKAEFVRALAVNRTAVVKEAVSGFLRLARPAPDK